MKTIRYILLGLSVLIAIPAFSNDEITVSLYPGIGITEGGMPIPERAINFGGLTGIGAELKFDRVAVSFGLGSDSKEHHDDGYYTTINKIIDNSYSSVGIKVYNNSKNQTFVGFNYLSACIDEKKKYTYPNKIYNECFINGMAVTAGYKYAYGNGIFISPYMGIEHGYQSIYNIKDRIIKSFTSQLFGLNVGYQFNPIKNVDRMKKYLKNGIKSLHLK